MLKSISIKNFRKHKDSLIKFDDRLTVLVGENDTGKSSLISAIQIISNGNSVVKDDFYKIDKDIQIEIELDGDLYGIVSSFKDGRVSSDRYTKISAKKASDLNKSIDSVPDDDLKTIARSLGIKLAGAPKASTIRDKIKEKLSDKANYEKGFFSIESAREFPCTTYSLGGIEFENIERFISETFFKSKQKSIWDSEINGNTLSEFIQGELDRYKIETEEDIASSGIISIIKSYIDSVDKIEVQPEFDKRDISVNLSVRLLTSSGENRVASGFGDGTKRRLTIALLQHKASHDASNSLYLFDEPDTHLHVRAQNDLLDAFDSISDAGNQVIVTTHSPFIMNAVDVKQVRMFNKYRDVVSIKGNILNEDDKTETLKELGIENIHLFFSRNFLIVEGETEEIFLKIVYKRIFGRTLSRDFIKLVNMRGVNNIIAFQRMLSEFVRKQDMFIVADIDAKPNTKDLIERLPEANVHYVGRKEFEDSFSPEVIYRAWLNYLGINSITPGPDWTSDNIADLYFDQAKIDDGVIGHLIRLNSGCSSPLNKITLGIALGSYCNEQHLPEEIFTLLRVVNSAARSSFELESLSEADQD